MWPLADVSLDIGRIEPADAIRQKNTAQEILSRLRDQPGVVLADEVGMGKTYVALAVAVSAVEATHQQVVVMVPPAVREKWPQEWQVFQSKCLAGRSDIRATETTVTRGSEFLALLDDPPARRKHIIFLSHSALAGSIGDDYLKFALVRQAFMYQRQLHHQRRALPRWAAKLFRNPAFRNEQFVAALLDNPPGYWARVSRSHLSSPLADDPVPEALVETISHLDLGELRKALAELPLKSSSGLGIRLDRVRRELDRNVGSIWHQWVRTVRLHLPLLIMDEAHHLRNPWTILAGLFEPEVRAGHQLTKGPLANVFDRMLFLTATPFQLGHGELIQILQRFDSVRWQSTTSRAEFNEKIDDLARVLDDAQVAAVRLDTSWGRLKVADIACSDSTSWWESPEISPTATDALAQVQLLRDKIKEVEGQLRPWVIRHVRPDRDARRHVYAGAAINDLGDGSTGLSIDGSAVLPFLLAARARAIVASEAVDGDPDRTAVRAYFAEGLASSYEAYRDTRSRANTSVDGEGAPLTGGPSFGSETQWYLRHLDDALPRGDDSLAAQHPKMAATVDRVRQLWVAGEKVVVFCFYVATGRALRYHISRELERELVEMASRKFGGQLPTPEVLGRLDQLGERFFDDNSPAARTTLAACMAILSRCGLVETDLETAATIVARFLRTPSFLARYVDLADEDLARAYQTALSATDASGVQLQRKIESFGVFLATRIPSERAAIFDALRQLPTGRIRAASAAAYDASELGDRPEILLPNVRLVNGGVKQETRRRLMFAFNTPFFPEVLIASAVLAEGVDLQLDCRHVIHHDLDWNPSVLEQRTGRVDRLGSKAEVSHRPICVFEPYVAGTQDEKQYRVVKDRERWFNVVMGARLKLDEYSTDGLAERVPLPTELTSELTFDLRVSHR